MSQRRDVRPVIYGVLDLVFASAYALTIGLVIPNRHASASLLLWSLVITCAAMGAATLSRHSKAYWGAVALCALQLVFTALLLVAIVVSAAYLAGIYGAYGKGASMLAVLAAVLAIQVFALLPAFQLKYLMSAAGRRAYGIPPRES